MHFFCPPFPRLLKYTVNALNFTCLFYLLTFNFNSSIPNILSFVFFHFSFPFFIIYQKKKLFFLIFNRSPVLYLNFFLLPHFPYHFLYSTLLPCSFFPHIYVHTLSSTTFFFHFFLSLSFLQFGRPSSIYPLLSSSIHRLYQSSFSPSHQILVSLFAWSHLSLAFFT